MVPEATSERYTIILENKNRADAIGDYEWDWSAIFASLSKDMLRADLFLPVLQASSSISLKATVLSTESNPFTFMASRYMLFSITVLSPGSNFPVRIRGKRILVADQEMDKGMLGRPFLRSLSFGLETHLKKMGKHIDGKHIDKKGPTDLKAGVVFFQGLVYQDTGNDRIELPRACKQALAWTAVYQLMWPFTTLSRVSRQKGPASAARERLEKALKKFRDVFLIKIVPDPPAGVTSLVITGARNARSHRLPQRTYAPVQQAFVAQIVRHLGSVGAMYKNPSARRAGLALAVSRLESTKPCFMEDPRGPN